MLTTVFVVMRLARVVALRGAISLIGTVLAVALVTQLVLTTFTCEQYAKVLVMLAV